MLIDKKIARHTIQYRESIAMCNLLHDSLIKNLYFVHINNAPNVQYVANNMLTSEQ